MERDSQKEELPLPSPQEAIVIRRILNRCLHEHTQRSIKRRMVESACSDCGESMVLGLESDDYVSPAEEARRWRASLPRPAAHLVVAEQALALAGRSGWHIQIRQAADTFVCTLSKEDRIVRSGAQRTRAAAIVEALARMANEYQFKG